MSRWRNEPDGISSSHLRRPGVVGTPEEGGAGCSGAVAICERADGAGLSIWIHRIYAGADTAGGGEDVEFAAGSADVVNWHCGGGAVWPFTGTIIWKNKGKSMGR